MNSFAWLGRVAALTAALGMGSACTEADDVDFPPPTNPPEIPDNPDPPEGYELQTLSSPATGAVSAIAADGTLRYAYIEGATEWPMVGGIARVALPLPGAREPAQGVAIAADHDGAIHLTWDAGGVVYYVRQRADGGLDDRVIVDIPPLEGTFPNQVVRSAEPTLAVAPNGDIVVAFTVTINDENSQPLMPPRIAVARGSLGDAGVVFGQAVNATPDCCYDDVIGEFADRMSGPTLTLDADGAAHIVFEWGTWADVVVEYIREVNGYFGTTVEISRAAFVPCPALAVDDEGAYITFLVEPTQDVWYVEVKEGIVSERVSLYTSVDYLTMSMLVRQPNGLLHLAITEQTAKGGRLLYVRTDGTEPQLVTEVETPGFVELSPRSGGLILSPDGQPIFGYELVPRFGDMGTAQLAIPR